MENNIIDRLAAIINVLNNIEVKGFENLKNLGLAIQQLDIIARQIKKQQDENKPKE